jgi:hypothetical protein
MILTPSPVQDPGVRSQGTEYDTADEYDRRAQARFGDLEVWPTFLAAFDGEHEVTNRRNIDNFNCIVMVYFHRSHCNSILSSDAIVRGQGNRR